MAFSVTRAVLLVSALFATRGDQDPLLEGMRREEVLAVQGSVCCFLRRLARSKGQGLVEARRCLLEFHRSRASGSTNSCTVMASWTTSCAKLANAQRVRCATGSGGVQRSPSTTYSSVLCEAGEDTVKHANRTFWMSHGSGINWPQEEAWLQDVDQALSHWPSLHVPCMIVASGCTLRLGHWAARRGDVTRQVLQLAALPNSKHPLNFMGGLRGRAAGDPTVSKPHKPPQHHLDLRKGRTACHSTACANADLWRTLWWRLEDRGGLHTAQVEMVCFLADCEGMEGTVVDNKCADKPAIFLACTSWPCGLIKSATVLRAKFETVVKWIDLTFGGNG